MFDDFDEDMEDYDGDSATTASDAISSLKPPRENQIVFGHEGIEQNLLSLFNQGNLPHALIFAGQKGIGKATLAYNLTRFLLKNGNDDAGQDSLFGDAPEPAKNFSVDPDDPIAHKVASGGHPDLLTIERPMDEKKGTQKSSIDVETVRKIAPFLRMTSSDGGWRIVIVDDAESMNRNAQNAILKILEEPPKKALLILICHRLGAMIPTIRSRCRTFHFQPPERSKLIDVLKRGAPDLREAEANLLADLSDGSVGRALALHDDGGTEAVGKILTLLETFPQWEWPLIHQTAENLGRFGSDAAYYNFEEIFLWVCERFALAKATGPSKLPEILRTDKLEALLNHYSLEQWVDICEKLKGHFTAVDISNLDKRQGVLGAFALIG